MNIQSSNNFYNILMKSNIFTKEQKTFINSEYVKCQNEVINKIKLSCRCSVYCGRPSKIKNKETFNEMVKYYKKGYINIASIVNIYKISRATFFRYAEKVQVEEKINNNISKENLKKIEELYNKHAWGYAEIWTNKLLTVKYREDMMQECLYRLWVGTLEYFTTKDTDLSIPYKVFCNNICEIVLNDYINKINNEKHTLNYDNYYSNDEKYNFLDNHIYKEVLSYE